MGCSRRFADSRFKEIVGHTILDEIRSVRIDRVKHLLVKPNQNIASIPDFCGYSSLSVLCREFKGATGFTLREWRRKNPSRDCSI
jgi:AraC-like DNA-binding protein